MNIDEIRTLVELLDQSSVAELVLEKEGFSLKLRKAVAEMAEQRVVPAAPQAVEVQKHPEAADRQEEETEDEDNFTIVAPMVGTFYRAPAPDAPPYVEVGDVIDVGQPLCIIEAMKLMNEIESEVRGRIKKILVENAQPVEYGQPLFIVEKI